VGKKPSPLKRNSWALSSPEPVKLTLCHFPINVLSGSKSSASKSPSLKNKQEHFSSQKKRHTLPLSHEDLPNDVTPAFTYEQSLQTFESSPHPRLCLLDAQLWASLVPACPQVAYSLEEEKDKQRDNCAFFQQLYSSGQEEVCV
jgi:hypothetical protein